MVDQGASFGSDRDSSQEGESEGIDLDQVRDLLGFVVHAARRRPKLTVLTFVTIAVLGLTVSATMPRAYRAEVKLLGQRSSALRMLSSSNPNMDAVDNPTKNAATMILRRDNLEALVKEANLVERFAQTRPAALRLKDRVMAGIFGPPSPKDLQLGMVFTLEHKLEVETSEETTVSISVEWSDPRTAYDLVTLVQKNFLEARYDSDVAVINESIAVLEEHAKNELAKVDSELEDYQKIVATTAAKSSPAAMPRAGGAYLGPRMAGGGATAVGPDPEVAKALEEKRIQIRTLEEEQRHAQESLRQQLLQAQTTLTPMHPAVIALQTQLEAASQPSPALVQARSDERQLMAQIVPPRLAPAPVPLPAVPHASGGAVPEADAGSVDQLPVLPPSAIDRDGRLQLAQSKLGAAIRSYQDVLARIDSARVELEITQTAYKHRYTVVSPAELPAKPKKATAQLVGIGSLVGGALLAILLAAALDFAGGSILESWQVRRRLRLEVLGEFDRTS
jgi:uncharacterized protein involved in exopolysaccharide biosynthesis